MRVNAVSFTAGAGRTPAKPLGQKKGIVPVTSTTNLKTADMVSISGLLGASVLSVYLIKKGNLDVGMRVLHI